jgi:hypothetical protein
MASSASSRVVEGEGYRQLLYFKCLPKTSRKYSVGTCADDATIHFWLLCDEWKATAFKNRTLVMIHHVVVTSIIANTKWI